LGSALEQYLKLDLNKWLKVLRHLELLPRPMGQDWSEVWLQRFSGTITIWPRTRMSDFWYILSDPGPQRLAHMIHAGQLAAWPKLKFIANRMAIEKVIEDAREDLRPAEQPLPTPALADEKGLRGVLSEEDLQMLLEKARSSHEPVEVPGAMLTPRTERPPRPKVLTSHRAESPSFSKRFSGWLGMQSPGTESARMSSETVRPSRAVLREYGGQEKRRASVIDEMRRQASVLWDDPEADGETTSDTEHEEVVTSEEEEVAPYERGAGAEDDGYGTVLRRKPPPRIMLGGEDSEEDEPTPTMTRTGSNVTMKG